MPRVILTGVALLIFVGATAAPAWARGSDDQFGMFYDGGYVPSNSQGIKMSYSISTGGVSCTSSSGWVSAINSVRTNGGSPNHWWLQAGIGFNCENYPSAAVWVISVENWDASGTPHDYTIATLSTTTYPTLSGTITINYQSCCSNWIESMYVSQASWTYTYVATSALGTYVDGSAGANDWTSVETPTAQAGLTFSSTFKWTLNSPQFLVGGTWQNWNVITGGYYWLYDRAVYKPANPNTNLLATSQISSYGVNVYYYGPNPPNNDGTVLKWRLNPCCAPSP